MLNYKIKLYSSVGNVKEGLENVKDTKELKAKLAALKIDTKNMAVLDANTDQEYDLDKVQALPEGDLQLYILPAKTKSGINF